MFRSVWTGKNVVFLCFFVCFDEIVDFSYRNDHFDYPQSYNFSKIKTNLRIEWGEMGGVSPVHFHSGTPKGGWRWCSWSQWSRMCETSEI